MKKRITFKEKKYIIAVMLLVFGIFTINMWFYGTFKKHIVSINHYSKEQVVNSISEYYKQINMLLDDFLTDTDLSMLQSIDDNKEIYRSQYTLRAIKRIKLTNELSDNIQYTYMYLEDMDLVVCASGVINPLIFYEVTGKEYVNSYDEWRDIAINAGQGLKFNVVGDSVIFTFVQRIAGTQSTFTIGMIANSKDVFGDNAYAQWVNACNVYVYDRYGTLSLFNENFKFNPSGELPEYNEVFGTSEKYDRLFQTVDVGDKQYDVVFLFEKGLDMLEVRRVQITFNIMTVILFSGLLYFLYLLIIERYKPVKAIAELLEINVEDIDYKFLEKPIKSIIDKNELLNNLLESKNDNLKMLVLDKLLKGSMRGDMLEEISGLGIRFGYQGFIVVILYLYNDIESTEKENKEIAKAFEESIFKMFEGDAGTAYFVPFDKYMVCIYNTDINTKIEDFGLKFAYLTKVVEMDYDFVASIAISNIHSEYWQIPMAYSEALEIISQSELFKKSKVVLYKDIEHRKRASDLESGYETKLTVAVRSANYEAAEQVIDQLIDHMADGGILLHSNEAIGLIYTLMRIADAVFGTDYNVQALSLVLKNVEDLPLLRMVCCDFAKKMCDEVAEMKKENQLEKKILELIHENFADPQFCMEYISELLDYSAVHLNNVFKTEYNMTIVSYLNNYRIQKAKEYILEGITFKEVASKVGIANIRTFNRLFQSVADMTPTEYRNENGIKNNDKKRKEEDSNE